MDDPLYMARRLLTLAAERLGDKSENKLMGLLRAGEPKDTLAARCNADTKQFVSSTSCPQRARQCLKRRVDSRNGRPQLAARSAPARSNPEVRGLPDHRFAPRALQQRDSIGITSPPESEIQSPNPIP